MTINLDKIYNTQSSYSIVSSTVNKKSPPTPVDIKIPVVKDTVVELNGEILQIYEYSQNNPVIL